MTSTPTAPRRLEYVDVDELRTADRNPRSHLTLEKVIGSMRKYGFVESAVHDGRTDKIIAGHGRQKALQKMRDGGEEAPEGVLVDAEGRWFMPVQYGWSSADDAAAETLLVNLNRLAEKGGWEYGGEDGLAVLLDELRTDFPDDFDLSGFEDPDVDKMLADLAAAAYDELEDPDDLDSVGEAPPEDATITRRGDVWVLGRHRLAVGDSADPKVVRAALGGAQAQMIFTDPPYGVSYEGGQRGMKIINDALSLTDLGKFLERVFKVMKDVLVPGGAFYICTSDIADGEIRNVLVKHEVQLRQQLVWVKDSLVMGRKDYHYQHEPMIYGQAAGGEPPVPPHFDPEHETMLYGWAEGAAHEFDGGRKQTTVWLYPKPRSSDLHPTMKPVALVRRAVLNSSRPGKPEAVGRVLDFFGGSGSTLIACEVSERAAALVELDLPYADVICRRFEKHTGVVPVREADGVAVSFLGGE